jgi:hypothetical protein
MERWEADSGLNGADDFSGDSTLVRYLSTSSSSTWAITGVVGSWTNWEESAVRSIHV